VEEQPKRPRGRPRKYPESSVSDAKYKYNLITNRGAQDKINSCIALFNICENCTIETQRYFLGGITKAEMLAGARKKCKAKHYVMQEIGRHPDEEMVGIAEAIANNRTYDTWTQHEIVDLLKAIRLVSRQLCKVG
jgi:hypothetical protein